MNHSCGCSPRVVGSGFFFFLVTCHNVIYSRLMREHRTLKMKYKMDIFVAEINDEITGRQIQSFEPHTEMTMTRCHKKKRRWKMVCIRHILFVSTANGEYLKIKNNIISFIPKCKRVKNANAI